MCSPVGILRPESIHVQNSPRLSVVILTVNNLLWCNGCILQALEKTLHYVQIMWKLHQANQQIVSPKLFCSPLHIWLYIPDGLVRLHARMDPRQAAFKLYYMYASRKLVMKSRDCDKHISPGYMWSNPSSLLYLHMYMYDVTTTLLPSGQGGIYRQLFYCYTIVHDWTISQANSPFPY